MKMKMEYIKENTEMVYIMDNHEINDIVRQMRQEIYRREHNAKI